MLPGTVTSWPRPIDSTMSCAGVTTDWASAGPAGAAASGAMAHAAMSADLRRRLFIVLPFVCVSIAVIRRLISGASAIALSRGRQVELRDPPGRLCSLSLAVEKCPSASADTLDTGAAPAGHPHRRAG